MALSDEAALREVWAARMPITGAMGIDLASLADAALVLAMPLHPNRNHKGTLFAGSLSALATLAGWSAIWLLVRDAGETAHVVIQDASIHYRHPVRTNATAHCPLPDPATRHKLLTTFRRRGRARVPLQVTVHDADGEVVATFSGRYVMHR